MIIYQIRNIINGNTYIGQTIQKFKYRKSVHLKTLRENRHRNIYLQNAWNKYGEDSFEFEVLEKCKSLDELNEREIELIKELGVYNFDSGGGNKHIRNKETLTKISKANSKKVYQYSLKGGYIQEFNSVKEASKILNISKSNISMCARKEIKTAGGYQWRYVFKKKINTAPDPYEANRKLNEEQVKEIRNKSKTMTQTKLAKLYGVSRRTIGDVVNYKLHKHVN